MSQRLSFHDQIQSNKIKSLFLAISIVIIFIFIGYLISLALDPSYFFIIMIIAIIFSLSYTLIGYYKSDKIALASVKAKPASRVEHIAFFNSAENMAIASGLPVPKLYVMQGDQINAFASGRDPKNAVICVTTGCLQKLNKQELEGVLAHEMAHIANYDIRFMTITTVLVGMIAIIAEIYLRSLWFSSFNDRDNKAGIIILVVSIVAAILAPLIANLVSLAISRKREYTADATAVKFTRLTSGLSSALKKIEKEHLDSKDKKRFNKATAPLFISDPFKKKFQNAFSTHPSIESRIKKLERM